MTCDNCIHYAVCKNIVNRNYNGDDICNDIENYCDYFKYKNNMVAVIRCKDCMHLREYPNIGLRFCVCTDNHCEYDDYCSNAERKE